MFEKRKENIFYEKYKTSFLYRLLFKDKIKMNDDHINLFIEIIKESKYKLQNKFPGIDFHVIFGILNKI